MSNLRMTCDGLGTLEVRVTRFTTPLTGSVTSLQTKTMLQHFPIKSQQQALVVEFVTNGWPEMNRIQDYIRQHQVRAMSGTTARPEIYLWWPQRGINNWSGFVGNMPAGDRRFNIAPRGKLEFLLVDSLLSEKTFTASIGTDFRNLFNSDIGKPRDPDDAIFTPPSVPKPGDPGFIGPVVTPAPARPGRSSGGDF